MLSTFARGTVLLPNDDVLPTADTSTECFEENLLLNGAFLPNSAHMLVSSLYQFLVLTISDLPGVIPATNDRMILYYCLKTKVDWFRRKYGIFLGGLSRLASEQLYAPEIN
jgi:hypothetical protein